jgi:hypothetical protein
MDRTRNKPAPLIKPLRRDVAPLGDDGRRASPGFSEVLYRGEHQSGSGAAATMIGAHRN